ncbi:hypothetical protein, partial [Klebsiella pneumoniae]|uniref:hypothetical protein n=1 Tax=Klebsiella pneumoniae TaxID=573 RepID=UPI003A4DD071
MTKQPPCSQSGPLTPSGFMEARQGKTTPLFAVQPLDAQRFHDNPAGQNNPLVRSPADLLPV